MLIHHVINELLLYFPGIINNYCLETLVDSYRWPRLQRLADRPFPLPLTW